VQQKGKERKCLEVTVYQTCGDTAENEVTGYDNEVVYSVKIPQELIKLFLPYGVSFTKLQNYSLSCPYGSTSLREILNFVIERIHEDRSLVKTNEGLYDRDINLSNRLKLHDTIYQTAARIAYGKAYRGKYCLAKVAGRFDLMAGLIKLRLWVTHPRVCRGIYYIDVDVDRFAKILGDECFDSYGDFIAKNEVREIREVHFRKLLARAKMVKTAGEGKIIIFKGEECNYEMLKWADDVEESRQRDKNATTIQTVWRGWWRRKKVRILPRILNIFIACASYAKHAYLF